MSGTVAERKRLIELTAGNVRQNHLYISEHLDFFPPDIVGASRLNSEDDACPVAIHLDGLGETIETDIGSDAKSGKPRRMFRKRDWVRRFIEHHKLQEGDVLAIERRGERDYRLYPFHTKQNREDDWHHWLEADPPPGKGPTAIELFAGCGGMALGFKEEGFRTVLANEWDAAACESLRANITEHII